MKLSPHSAAQSGVDAALDFRGFQIGINLHIDPHPMAMGGQSFCAGSSLITENIPILTTLKSWKYGLESPFKVDVYYVPTAVSLAVITTIIGTALPSAIRLSNSTSGLAKRCHSVSSPPMPWSR